MSMNKMLLAGAALVALSVPGYAQVATLPGTIPGQDAAIPGTPGEARLSRNGAGPDSGITGYSESGAGGTGGAGGILSNGTSDNAGTATGGPSGGRPDGEGS